MRTAVLLVVLLAVGSVGADEALEVVRHEEGYRIARPTAAWRVRELGAPAGTHHALKVEGSPAPRETSVTVYLADAPAGATAQILRDAAAGRWAARAVGSVDRETTTLAGEPAPSLVCEVEAYGARVRVRQSYLLHDGDVVLVQTLAPADASEAQRAEIADTVASFAFLPPDAERDEERRIRAIAARCGSEVPKARTWAEASERAAREKRLVLVVFEEFHGLPYPPLADTTTFMDEDVVALCRERFVVLPWADDLHAPFDRPDRFGLGAHTFGQGVLFATPAGDVVGALGLLEPSLVDEAARAALAAAPPELVARETTSDPAVAFARGDLDRTEALLAGRVGVDDRLLEAALFRRRQQGSLALGALEEARKTGALTCEVAAARGLLLLRTGRLTEAVATLRAACERPAARYWLAVARAMREGIDPVRGDLRALALDPAATRWSWRAAAVLLGRGVATGMEAVVWADRSVHDAAILVPPRAPATDAEAARAGALARLLAAQRPDGTWPVPMAFAPDPSAPTVVAVTSIAGSALRAHRCEKGVTDAMVRALDAVMRSHTRIASARAGIFDYGVWAQAFALRFVVACADDVPGPESVRRRAAAQDLVTALARTQAPSGGWSYARLESAGASADNSISFLTAAVLLALLEAREARVAVPAETIDRAVALVAKLRRADGTWEYQTATQSVGPSTEAALRGPLCALALARAGRPAAATDVPDALVRLLAQFDAAAAEAGKPLCHTAPDATSAYYLAFGLRYAAEAVATLPKERSATTRAGLRAAALQLRRADGSFLDFPPIGPSYGTAMALETLDRVR